VPSVTLLQDGLPYQLNTITYCRHTSLPFVTTGPGTDSSVWSSFFVDSSN